MSSGCYGRIAQWGLQELMHEQPGLRIRPSAEDTVFLAGILCFSADKPGLERIDDEFEVEIAVSSQFPNEIPHVWETGGRIPKSYHKFENQSLCLGSPARLRMLVKGEPTLLAFVRKCVIPYLYGFSLHSRNGLVPFGELAHGVDGLIQDYTELFGVADGEVVVEMVRLASLNKRDANRLRCPCGSGRRLGKCHNRRINEMRKLLGRKWLAEEFQRLIRMKERVV